MRVVLDPMEQHQSLKSLISNYKKMTYIFYRPETLQIMGMSTDPKSMEFPYVETEKKYHSATNLKIEEKNGKFELKLKKG